MLNQDAVQHAGISTLKRKWKTFTNFYLVMLFILSDIITWGCKPIFPTLLLCHVGSILRWWNNQWSIITVCCWICHHWRTKFLRYEKQIPVCVQRKGYMALLLIFPVPSGHFLSILVGVFVRYLRKSKHNITYL